MSSGGGKQTTEVKLPGFVNDASKDVLTRAIAQSNAPYTSYTGQRIADFAPDQLSAFDLTRSSIGSWEPDVAQSEGLAALAGRQWSPEVASQYINPYAKNVTDISARELVRADDIARKTRNANAAAEGAFGGAQAGVVEAEAGRNLQQSLADLYQRGGKEAYDSGLAAFSADRSAALGASGALSNLATARQGLAQADIEGLLTSGTIQQQQEQNALDQIYQEWLTQQEHPWTQLQKAAGILSQTPYGQKTATSGGAGSDQTGTYVGAGTAAAATVAAAVIIA